MKEIFCTIADFFAVIFTKVEALGNTLNYIYMAVIFIFLVLWTFKMIKHRKDNEEHAPL
tara:strand:+ start:3858 stop:4034 length:177 start_codon:yes stop_codon:yes gene_type:complete